jgi:hypothetical protein
MATYVSEECKLERREIVRTLRAVEDQLEPEVLTQDGERPDADVERDRSRLNGEHERLSATLRQIDGKNEGAYLGDVVISIPDHGPQTMTLFQDQRTGSLVAFATDVLRASKPGRVIAPLVLGAMASLRAAAEEDGELVDLAAGNAGDRVLIQGNPVDGISITGPFEDSDAANAFAENQKCIDWWVASLDAPVYEAVS